MTQSDKIFNDLLEKIISGQLPSGSRLREADVAQEFGTGRGPLREALQRLESRKLVTKIPHVGAQVVALELTELVEIYQLRESLEGLACELAAQKMDQETLDKLSALLIEHEQFLTAHEGQLYIDQDADLDFHFQIIQASGNRWLTQLLCDELYHRIRMYRAQTAQTPKRPVLALREHQQILWALQQRDGELASMLMKRHIRAARNALESQIQMSETGENL